MYVYVCMYVCVVEFVFIRAFFFLISFFVSDTKDTRRLHFLSQPLIVRGI